MAETFPSARTNETATRHFLEHISWFIISSLIKACLCQTFQCFLYLYGPASCIGRDVLAFVFRATALDIHVL